MIYLPIESVEQNTGQIEGLPSNPRQWSQSDVSKIAKSLKDTPELFEARPLIVYPRADKYVILGGNLRYEGAKKNKMTKIPAHILKENLPVEKLREIVIKDNGSFGEWDMDMLANEWDDLNLEEWGVPMWFPERPRNEETPDLRDVVQPTYHQPTAIDTSALPAELQGRDIAPDDLPKIQGDNETAMERVIIVYPKDRADEMAAKLGLDGIKKVVYNIDEIV